MTNKEKEELTNLAKELGLHIDIDDFIISFGGDYFKIKREIITASNQKG